MKIRKLLAAFISALIILSVTLAFTCRPEEVKPLIFEKGDKYEKEWAKVDSLEKLGLPKSAGEIIEQIYIDAKSKNNHEQYIKSLTYKMKYKNAVEEFSFVDVIYDIEAELKTAKYPNDAVLNYMLAELYWDYYSNNRWKFYNRTATTQIVSDDISTWDLNNLVDKVIKNYSLALQNRDSLQRTPINIYAEVLIKGNMPVKLRPTLYDFIAHNAIDKFSYTEIGITRPANKFQLKEDFYFEDAEDFIERDFSTTDTMAFDYYSITLLQELLKYHINNKNTDALIASDLKRLDIVYKNSVNDLKDSLYINSLKRLEKENLEHAAVADIKLKIAYFYNDKSSNYDFKNEDTFKYKSYKKIAINICDDVINSHPDTNTVLKFEKLKRSINKKTLKTTGESIIPSNQKFAVKFDYKNVDTIYLKIASIDRDVYRKLNKKYYSEELYEKLVKEIKKVSTKAIVLPVDKDYNSHSVEDIFEGLPYGKYIFIASNNSDFAYNDNNNISYRAFDVSDLSYTKRKLKNGDFEVFVVNRFTGKPVSGVNAQVLFKKYNSALGRYKTTKGKLYTTDKNGYVRIPYTDNNTRNFYLELTKGEDYLNSNRSFYSYHYKTFEKPDNNIFLFTDRGIYRPGQTVFFKGILLEQFKGKNDIVPNHNVKVEFIDVNYQPISELNLTTNEYGSINGSFTIPMELLNGTMQIRTPYGTQSISVEEYKRPKFEVEMLPIKGSFVLNDDVEVKGKATSFAGSPISDSKVSYRVVREPIWRWWYHRSSTTEIANGELTTNEKGEFTVKFKAIPDLSIKKSDNISFRYTVYVDVTDINGETRSSNTSARVGYKELELSTSIPNILNNKDGNKFIVNTTNLNGEDVFASGNITVYKIVEKKEVLRDRKWAEPDKFIYTEKEWKSKYPNNIYKEVADIDLPTAKTPKSQFKFNTKNSKEFKLDKLSKWEPGKYKIVIRSVDTRGNKVVEENVFTLYSVNTKTLPVNDIKFTVPVNNHCKPGEETKFIIGSAAKDVSVFYDIETHSGITKQKRIILNGEQKLITIPIKEEHRGNLNVYFSFVKNNRFYSKQFTVTVPYTNKELDVEFATFRNKLSPGQEEEWTIKIKDSKGDKVAAEMLATLYDASLDQFRPVYWSFNINKYLYSNSSLQTDVFGTNNSQQLNIDKRPYIKTGSETYNRFNWFGFSYHGYGLYLNSLREDEGVVLESVNVVNKRRLRNRKAKKKYRAIACPSFGNAEECNEVAFVADIEENDQNALGKLSLSTKSDKSLSKIKTRTNFNETAFFYPNLKTNEDGDVIIKFTIPESLTKWKMKGFAHTKDLKYGFVENELITQKELMLLPNMPRFLRENDNIEIPVKVSNLTEKELTGTARLEFFDAITMKPLDILKENTDKNFTVKAKQNSLVTWQFKVPEGIGAVTYKVVAKAGKFSDGEENAIPVLTNRMLVTEAMPLPVRGNQTKEYKFEKLINSGSSKTLRHHRLTLEVTSNPAWYAVQSLPYLMEYPYECSEQTFSRFYANSIATHIANSSPKIKKVFDRWKGDPNSKELISKLEKNQELKSLLLEETPWVLDAKNETESKRRIGLLFDLNRMSGELSRSVEKLKKAQVSSGGWPWFKGMPESRYITQHIITGFGHLKNLNVLSDKDYNVNNMLKNGVKFLDKEIVDDYKRLKKHYSKKELENNHLGYIQIQYLYARSYFRDVNMSTQTKEAFEYYLGQAKKYWLSESKYMQAMIALSLNRFEDTETPKAIIKSLKEHAIHSEEMGMYWKEKNEYYWYQAPIERQALMIELFDEVAKDDKSVEDLKVWLLKQKQTQNWKTTKATTEAVYALLLRGTDLLANDKLVEVKLGDKVIDPTKIDGVTPEAGTGYYKTSWTGGDIKPEMGNIIISKDTDGVAWGALYWQYFEDLDKITPHETPLKLQKKLFIERNTSSGKVIEEIKEGGKMEVGDKIIVRIELRVDRDMEYVHMKDMRASGLEPINVISRYKYQEGIGYYESTKDAATNFFISYLRKGTYVFEYPLRASHKGEFSNGITSIQCMYAPEFGSHSEGLRIKIDK